jgi:chromosomal replication initiation ATPase DnaA
MSKEITLEDDAVVAGIQKLTAWFEVTFEEMQSKSREARLVKPRHMLMYYLSRECCYTTPEIAYFLNREHHTTCLHGFQNVMEQWQDEYEKCFGIPLRIRNKQTYEQTTTAI